VEEAKKGDMKSERIRNHSTPQFLNDGEGRKNSVDGGGNEAK